jgi:hypothetical protein
MSTKRTPLRRDTRRQITPEAADLFRQMEALKLRCTRAPIDWKGACWKQDSCAACDERQRLQGELHSALALKPWEWPAYQHPDSVCPYPAGSHAAQHWKSDERGVELYLKLKEAAA